MAYLYTVEEAASVLGVSRARVYQLIGNGALAAEKTSGVWFVDEQAVDARRSAKPHAGRPSSRTHAVSDVRRYTLMNRTHEVLEFAFDVAEGSFSEGARLIDGERAPVGLLSPRGKRVSSQALTFWWRHRSIPRSRAGLDAKLRECGLGDPSLLPFRSLGLSLSDQYWVRPEGSSVQWQDVNFFQNEFAELSSDGDWLGGVGLDSPDNTSEGELPKTWLCDKRGVRVLAKGGTALGQEPYNEVVATALHRRLLEPGEYVPYRLGERAGEPVSLCDVFISDGEEYVPAHYARKVVRQANHHSDYQHYLECCAHLGVEGAETAMAKMILCDDILGNFDRHWRNFGLVRDVETLEYRIAPIFDSGSSLWCRTPGTRLAFGDYSFETKPFYEDANRQLRLVNDFSWFNPAALEGFPEEAADILSANNALAERIGHIQEAIRFRIDRIIRML